jgi:hypothetical protein
VNNVTIKTKEFFEGDVNVSVFDLQGREVLSSTFQNNGRFSQSIDVSSLVAGEYIVKLNNGTSSYTDKLFVTR